jgi:hypothetical protein
MRNSKRLLIALGALAAAGLTGCLTTPDSSLSGSTANSALHSNDSIRTRCDSLKARLALLDTNSAAYDTLLIQVVACSTYFDTTDHDTLRLGPPPACQVLKAKLASADSGSRLWFNMRRQVAHVCSITRGFHPDTLDGDTTRPESIRPPPVKPDTTRPDSVRQGPKPDSLGNVSKPDSVRQNGRNTKASKK